MSFLDVGQGDCTVAADLESNECIVIDCPAAGLPALDSLLDETRIAEPTLIIVTHSDTDHMAGAVELSRTRGATEVRYNHDRILPGDPSARTRWKAALRALAALDDAGISTGPATGGVSGTVGAISYRIVAPTHAMVSHAQIRGEPNHASAVVRFQIGAVVVLVGGDADPESWRRTLDAGADIRADVFRLPHHGASIDRTAVSWDELFAAVRPQAVIVSVGSRNRYGHPAQDTLAAIQRHAVDVRALCTEINPICRGAAAAPDSAIARLPVASLRGLGGRPGAARCAGTVALDITGDRWLLSPSVEEHGGVIDLLEHPMCRPAQLVRPADL